MHKRVLVLIELIELDVTIARECDRDDVLEGVDHFPKSPPLHLSHVVRVRLRHLRLYFLV